jgi:hypothetical protein
MRPNRRSFTTPSGTVPSEAVKLALSKQTIQWKTGKDSIAATVPGLYEVVLRMGSHSYRTAVHFDVNGGANAISAVRPCFVLEKGKLNVGNAGADSATLSLLLSDASFVYKTNDTLRIRLLEGATVLVERDFTALGQGQQSIDKFGKLVFSVKSLLDASTQNQIRRFSYSSAKGKMLVALSRLSLGGITNSEAHLTVEVTIGERIYTTGVSFFGGNPGTYSTSIP